MMERRHAFSLTELLVALVLVAFLMVLGLRYGVSLTHASRAALHTQQHRQIAAALVGYASEHRGDLPYATETVGASSSARVWTRLLTLGGYVHDPEIFFSPWNERKWWLEGGLGSVLRRPDNENTNPWYYVSYGVSRKGAMPRKGLDNAKTKVANLNVVAAHGDLSNLMLLRDVYSSGAQERGGGIAWFTRATNLPLPEHRRGYDRIHASFADGRVESYTMEQYLRLGDGDPTAAPFLENEYVW